MSGSPVRDPRVRAKKEVGAMRHQMLLFAVFAGLALVVNAAHGADRAAGAASASDLDLNGVWRGYVVDGKGEQPDRGSVHLELTVKGNHISARRLDGSAGPLGEGTYKITVGRYYLIDAVETRSGGKPRTYLGICAFGPDLMRWSVSTPGNKRPTTFETKGQQFLLILKRQR
jgi:hypothetical protein